MSKSIYLLPPYGNLPPPISVSGMELVESYFRHRPLHPQEKPCTSWVSSSGLLLWAKCFVIVARDIVYFYYKTISGEERQPREKEVSQMDAYSKQLSTCLPPRDTRQTHIDITFQNDSLKTEQKNSLKDLEQTKILEDFCHRESTSCQGLCEGCGPWVSSSVLWILQGKILWGLKLEIWWAQGIWYFLDFQYLEITCISTNMSLWKPSPNLPHPPWRTVLIEPAWGM